MKNLRLRFSPYGFVIVALQSLPNILWALAPPTPNALEGNASSIPFIEFGEHFLGVLTVIMLLFLVNKLQARTIPMNGWTITSFVAIALYWLCWALYFAGIQPNLLLYAMCVLPPVAFFSAGIAGKVWPISAASVIFLAFHLAVAFENYPIGGF